MNDGISTISILDSTSDGGHQWWQISEQCELEFRTLQQGRSQGVQVLNVKVGRVQLSVLLSRAGNVGSLSFDNISVGWKSPVAGPVHPGFVPLYRPDGLGWLEGFDEVLARCGLGNVGGPEFDEQGRLVQPIHGALSYQPCRSATATVNPQTRTVDIQTVVEECVFHFHRLELQSKLTISMDEPWIRVEDTITNLGARPGEVMLLHHWNFGPPVVDAGSRFYVSHQRMAPRNHHAAQQVSGWDTMPAAKAGSEETVYFFEPAADAESRATAMACSDDHSRAVSLSWNPETLPCFTLWRNPVDSADGYAAGLEPGTCFPNGRSHENRVGRTRQLLAGESHRVEVQVTGWMEQAEQLRQKIGEVQNLSASATRFDRPQAEFGPVDE